MRKWKQLSEGKTALMIEGARRIGKTTIAEEFARNEYQDYMLLDFARESRDVKNLFVENIGDIDIFFRNLFLLKGRELPVHHSVIILDEVQLFPAARQAVKFLVQDGRYDYIETGSLISIRKNVENILIPSEEYSVQMYPMDFEEFLWAQGNTVLGPYIKECFDRRRPLGDQIFRQAMKQFRTYLAVGGMPQAVADFVNKRTYAQIDFTKRTILKLYEEDLHKYDREDHGKAAAMFETIPDQLENRNAIFRFTKVSKNARYGNSLGAIEFLDKSMLVNLCVNVTEPQAALEGKADHSNFKMYLGDTGLLVTQILNASSSSDDAIYRKLIFGNLGTDEGRVLENMTAQMLRASGHRLFFHEYYYQPEGTQAPKKYEIDFLIVRRNKVCPIEVKSSGYRQHRSFDYFIQKYPIKVEDRYILYTKDVRYEDGVTYLPIFMAGLL
ncbi:MAG: ATP-binding protein [Lachnospiraceae bacterium]